MITSLSAFLSHLFTEPVLAHQPTLLASCTVSGFCSSKWTISTKRCNKIRHTILHTLSLSRSGCFVVASLALKHMHFAHEISASVCISSPVSHAHISMHCTHSVPSQPPPAQLWFRSLSLSLKCILVGMVLLRFHKPCHQMHCTRMWAYKLVERLVDWIIERMTDWFES